MDLHGELTEVQEWKDRQGLERRDFRLLAVTAFPLSRGSACAFLTGLTGWMALINPAVSLWTALPDRVLRMTAITLPRHQDDVDSWQGRPHQGAERPRVSPWSSVSPEGRVAQWSSYKWSSKGRTVPRRTEPKRVSAASAERTGFDRFHLERTRSGRSHRPKSPSSPSTFISAHISQEIRHLVLFRSVE